MSEQLSVANLIGTNAVKNLASNLKMSDEQLAKANSSALKIANDSKLKNCNPFSVIRYCYEIARYNFTKDDSCYPVPYGNNIQAQISYKGFKELAERSGKYSKINASVVYSCDKLTRDRETGDIKVVFNEDYNQMQSSKIIGYYAYAYDKDSHIVATNYMSKDECEKHGRRYSKAYNSIWTSDFNKMALKTTLKALCKKLDTTPLIEEAIALDQKVFDNGLNEGRYSDNPNNKDKNKAIEEVKNKVEEAYFVDIEEEEKPLETEVVKKENKKEIEKNDKKEDDNKEEGSRELLF